jgi:hypothetical protein
MMLSVLVLGMEPLSYAMSVMRHSASRSHGVSRAFMYVALLISEADIGCTAYNCCMRTAAQGWR